MVQENAVDVEVQQGPEQVAVLNPRGRLDVASTTAFRGQVRQLVDSGVSRLVVDLGDVSFVDSSGLGAILGGLKAARQNGGDLRIARPNEQVRLVLELTSLNLVLQPYGSLEEALSTSVTVVEVEVGRDLSPQQLDTVHEAMARCWLAMEAPPADGWRMRFEVAVSEIAANIIEHARPPVAYLRLTLDAGRLVAEFRDTGQGWAGQPEPKHMPDEFAERGRGLTIARAAVDEVVYDRADGINRWQLIKRL
jgi:anti-sigma B factor antagonist